MDYSRLAFFFNSGFHYVEVFAGLFPYLQARRRAVTIVIVARCTPEIRLDTETVLEILNTVYLVRGNDARFLSKTKETFDEEAVSRLFRSLIFNCGPCAVYFFTGAFIGNLNWSCAIR